MEKFSTQKSFERKLSVEEEIFKQYVYDLKLKPEDFNKIILDIGAGDTSFAKWAKSNNISSLIYCLEPLKEISLEEKSLVASGEEIPMPDEYFNLIISNGVIPNVYLNEFNVKEKIKNFFSEMLRVLKDGGEIRLAHVLIGSRYQYQLVFADSIKESLEELQRKYDFEIKKIHIPLNDSYEYDENHIRKGLLAESFLIILKKINNNNLV